MVLEMSGQFNYYQGRIPACGVFCGGCPVYTRIKKPCPGAEANRVRCENCKTFHLCCRERNLTNCYQCTAFPCRKFRDFASRWMKYGQDLIRNQYILKKKGKNGFLAHYNLKVNSEYMKYTIRLIEKITEKRTYYPLLLDADPSREMVERYLKEGALYVVEDKEETLGVVVVLRLSDEDCEIKNIAVLQERQYQGIGRWILEFVARNYQGVCKRIYVGTADAGIGFYEKCGFKQSHIVKNFFTENYPEPLFDNGIQCVDMIYLVKEL